MKDLQATSPSTKNVKGYVLRRSPRAMVKIPVVIKGVDKHGFEFEEDTETYIVSKFGARIFSIHELDEDARLQLKVPPTDQWSDFRVVWIGRQEEDAIGHIGIEFIQTTNFFGVNFPGEDWA